VVDQNQGLSHTPHPKKTHVLIFFYARHPPVNPLSASTSVFYSNYSKVFSDFLGMFQLMNSIKIWPIKLEKQTSHWVNRYNSLLFLCVWDIFPSSLPVFISCWRSSSPVSVTDWVMSHRLHHAWRLYWYHVYTCYVSGQLC
jgi:hypothetical protein